MSGARHVRPIQPLGAEAGRKLHAVNWQDPRSISRQDARRILRWIAAAVGYRCTVGPTWATGRAGKERQPGSLFGPRRHARRANTLGQRPGGRGCYGGYPLLRNLRCARSKDRADFPASEYQIGQSKRRSSFWGCGSFGLEGQRLRAGSDRSAFGVSMGGVDA